MKNVSLAIFRLRHWVIFSFLLIYSGVTCSADIVLSDRPERVRPWANLTQKEFLIRCIQAKAVFLDYSGSISAELADSVAPLIAKPTDSVFQVALDQSGEKSLVWLLRDVGFKHGANCWCKQSPVIRFFSDESEQFRLSIKHDSVIQIQSADGTMEYLGREGLLDEYFNLLKLLTPTDRHDRLEKLRSIQKLHSPAPVKLNVEMPAPGSGPNLF